MRNWEWEDGHSSVCKGPRRPACAACVPVSGPVKLEVALSTGAAPRLLSALQVPLVGYWDLGRRQVRGLLAACEEMILL